MHIAVEHPFAVVVKCQMVTENALGLVKIILTCFIIVRNSQEKIMIVQSRMLRSSNQCPGIRTEQQARAQAVRKKCFVPLGELVTGAMPRYP